MRESVNVCRRGRRSEGQNERGGQDETAQDTRATEDRDRVREEAKIRQEEGKRGRFNKTEKGRRDQDWECQQGK